MNLNIIQLYFYIYLIIALIRDFNIWEQAYPIPFTALIMVLVDILTAVAIFGYSYRKEILHPWVWRIFIPIQILVTGYVLYISNANNFFVFLWAFAMHLPAPYVIYLYGFQFRWIHLEKKDEIKKPESLEDEENNPEEER